MKTPREHFAQELDGGRTLDGQTRRSQSGALIWTTLGPFLLGVVAFGLSGQGLLEEGTVSLGGDMPRYLMNGAYFYDLLRDWPVAQLRDYTTEYYARYPALSLGHHPLLIGLAQVPFFAFLGISVFAAKLSILVFLGLAVGMWFHMVKTLYNEPVALLSSLFFVTSPMIVEYSRIMMAEIPTLALLIVASWWFLRYCEREEPRDAAGYVVSFVLACYAKQMAIFLFPVFFIYLASTKGIRYLIKKESILSCLTIVVLLIPLAIMTWEFSPVNVGAVVAQQVDQPSTAPEQAVAEEEEGFESLPIVSFLRWKLKAMDWLYFPGVLWTKQLAEVPVLISVLTMGVMVWRRERHAGYFLLWIIALYGLVTYMDVHIARLAIYWIPPFCLFAAWSVVVLPARLWRGLILLLLVASLGYQFSISYALVPDHGEGYEAAASYVLNQAQGSSVLYSANVDTGYFVFFVRKLDPDRRLVVLRADKVLATSFYDGILEDKITTREELYEILQDFGTCYVVVENGPYESYALKLLMEEVKSEQFLPRQTIQLRSQDPRLAGVALEIFEYRSCGPPNNEAELDMDLPMVNRSIGLKFSDLFDE